MNELKIIKSLKKNIKNPSALKLNDDVFFDKKKSLVGTIDTYNENIHYLNFKNPDLLIKKVIRSSISDIICKGIDPKYILISFSGSKKNFNNRNIKLIITSIKEEQKKYKFFLIGGDTTYSSKSSFTVCSLSYSNKIIKRGSCLNNDDIYITGNIGESSVGLYILKNKFKTTSKIKKYFINRYFKPSLPFGFHKDLNKFANSSMDLSDGLLIDLVKLIGDKKFSFVINYNKLPKSTYFEALLQKKKIFPNNHLFSGDDYQILFTAKKKYRNIISKSSKKWNQKVTRIGCIQIGSSNYMQFNNKLKKIHNYQGYIHNFS